MYRSITHEFIRGFMVLCIYVLVSSTWLMEDENDDDYDEDEDVNIDDYDDDDGDDDYDDGDDGTDGDGDDDGDDDDAEFHYFCHLFNSTCRNCREIMIY